MNKISNPKNLKMFKVEKYSNFKKCSKLKKCSKSRRNENRKEQNKKAGKKNTDLKTLEKPSRKILPKNKKP
jgi:hypothetical protein